MANSYSDGTASITSGTAALTGTGTAWSTQVKPGDAVVHMPTDAAPVLIGYVSAVGSDTAITLQDDYNGTTLSGVPYRIIRGYGWWTGAAPNETFLQFALDMAGKGLAGVTSGVPNAAEGRENELRVDTTSGVIYQKRSGTWTAVASGFAFDAFGLAAGLSAHDAEAAGYTYFATDESGFYVKLSAASADWSDLISLVGPAGDNTTAANVTVTPAGNIASENVQDALEELDGEKVGSSDISAITKITQTAYDALDPPDDETLYVIVDDE